MTRLTPHQRMEVERGFSSRMDPVPCWIAWRDGQAKRVTFRCICGLERPLRYKAEQPYHHKAWACGFRATLKLKGFFKLDETKAERKKRRAKENDGVFVPQ